MADALYPQKYGFGTKSKVVCVIKMKYLTEGARAYRQKKTKKEYLPCNHSSSYDSNYTKTKKKI